MARTIDRISCVQAGRLEPVTREQCKEKRYPITLSLRLSAAFFRTVLQDLKPKVLRPLSRTVVAGIVYTGLVTTAAALWLESTAFSRVPATDASIILTTEPLFAAAVGAATLGETFGPSDYVGAALIVGACALAVLAGQDDEEEEA